MLRPDDDQFIEGVPHSRPPTLGSQSDTLRQLPLATLIYTAPNDVVCPMTIVSFQVVRNIDVVIPMPVRLGIATYSRAMFGPNTQAERRCGGRQRALPQGCWCGGRNPGCRCKPPILAQVFS